VDICVLEGGVEVCLGFVAMKMNRSFKLSAVLSYGLVNCANVLG
jgi:hypothetical protein